MSQDFLVRAQKEGLAELFTSNVVMDDHVPFRPSPASKQLFNIPRRQTLNEQWQDYQTYATQITAYTGAWTANMHEFRINSSHLDELQGASVEINIANATGGNIQLVNAPLLVDNIEFLHGSRSLFKVYGEQLWNGYQYYINEKFLQHQPVLNMSTTFGAGTNVADGSSATYLVSLNPHFIAKQAYELPLYALRGDLIVRVTLNSAAKVFVTGTTCTISSIKLRVHGQRISAVERMERMKKLASAPYQFKFLLPSFLTMNVGSETSGTEVTQTLSSITGLVSHMWIWERATGATGSGLQTPVTITQYDVLDENGISVLGGPLTNAFARSVYLAQFVDSQMSVNKAIYPICFDKDPSRSLRVGIQSGFEPMVGRHRLRYTPGDTASHDLIICYYTWALLTIVNGELIISTP